MDYIKPSEVAETFLANSVIKSKLPTQHVFPDSQSTLRDFSRTSRIFGEE